MQEPDTSIGFLRQRKKYACGSETTCIETHNVAVAILLFAGDQNVRIHSYWIGY